MIRTVLVASLVHSLFAFGCSGTKASSVSAFELRTGIAGSQWNSFSVEEQKSLRRGKTAPGQPELALYLAYGQPMFHWQTTIEETPCRVLLYAGRKSKKINRVAYACNGRVALVERLSPKLPCWRIAEVGPRIVKASKYFDGLALGRQWEIVTGLLKRGHGKRDVRISFGKPYSRGREVREDGTKASTQVFLDHGGDSYGLYVTLVDDQVVSWRVPADRKMTPEAQKRRLNALEKRLTEKLKAMDEAAERRHAETVEHLNTIQDNQAQIRADIAAQTEKVARAAMVGAMVGTTIGQQARGMGGAPRTNTSSASSGERPNRRKTTRRTKRTITINGRSYTGGKHLGKECSLEAPCPDGYACTLVTDSGGMCTQ